MSPSVNTPAAGDPEIASVAEEYGRLDPSGLRTAQVLRDTLDQLYDGQRTGRYRWDQLHKTEKTHCGTLVEINLHREFNFEDGTTLDYQITNVEVDCKYSQTLNAWMIPPEAHGHLCLLVWAEDQASKWSLGIVRVAAPFLNTGGNRDCKSTLNQMGRNSITWLFKNAELPPNVLLQLQPETVRRILGQSSGQRKVNELFRCTLGMRVGRGVIATVAQQDDFMKRVRRNGGARTLLQSEGIVILGQYQSHCEIAETLGVAIPARGDSVPVRLTPARGPGRGIAKIGSGYWRLAATDDPVVPAPLLPRV